LDRSSFNYMDRRSSNDGISILFTESHKILSNFIDGYGMYEIRMTAE